MAPKADQEQKERTGVNVRVNEANKLFLDVWHRGGHARKYTGLPDTPRNRERCEKVQQLILREMELQVFTLSAFDITKYLPEVRQRRKRVQTPVPQDRTFLEFGEGEWYANKRAASEAKAKEYLGDLHIIAETEIDIDGKKVKFGDIKIRHMQPEYTDKLTIELRKRPGHKREVLGGDRLNTLLRKVTRSILDLAYERELVPKNPHRWFKKQRVEKVDIDPFSIQEMLAFLAALPESKWQRYFTVAFGTGMSPSEQFALEWKHIDFTAKRISIRQGFVKGRLTLLKTEERHRDIEMFPHVEQALHEQWEATHGQGRWVFANADGGPLHLDNLRNRVWNPTLTRAGLRPRNPYQTRHSYASQLLSEGADPAWVARMMGHSNTRMIVMKYWVYLRNRAHQDGRGYLDALGQARERSQDGNHP